MFGYLDKYGILHIADEVAARKYSKSGFVVKTNIPNEGGYPLIKGTNSGHVVVYTKENKFKADGVEYPMEELKEKFPEVASLVEELK